MAMNKVDARRLSALTKVIDRGDPGMLPGSVARSSVPVGRPIGVLAHGREWIYGLNRYSVSGFVPTDETLYLPGWQAARADAAGHVRAFELSQGGDLAGEIDSPRLAQFLANTEAFVSMGDDEWDSARRRFQAFAAGVGVATLSYPTTRGVETSAIIDMHHGKIEVIPPVQPMKRGAVAVVDSPLVLTHEWADGTSLRLASKRVELAAGFVGSGGALTAFGLGPDGHTATPDKRLAVFHSSGGSEFCAVMQMKRPAVNSFGETA